jgi:hypothetical protein
MIMSSFKINTKPKEKIIIGNNVFNYPDNTLLEVLQPLVFKGIILRKKCSKLYLNNTDEVWYVNNNYIYEIITLL